MILTIKKEKEKKNRAAVVLFTYYWENVDKFVCVTIVFFYVCLFVVVFWLFF